MRHRRTLSSLLLALILRVDEAGLCVTLVKKTRKRG